MKRLTLRKKFLIVFLSVGVIVAVLTGISVGTMNKLAGNYADTINGNYSIAAEAAEMNRNTEALEKYILAAIAAEDTVLTDNYLNMAQTELDSLKEHYESIKASGAVSDELLDPIGEFVNNDMQVQKTLFSSIRGGSYNIARSIFFSEYRTAIENVNVSVNNLSSVMSSSSTVWARSAEISHFGGRRACIILCLLCVSIITFAGLYLEKALPDENGRTHHIGVPEMRDEKTIISQNEAKLISYAVESVYGDGITPADNLENVLKELEKAETALNFKTAAAESTSRELDILKAELEKVKRQLNEKSIAVENADNELSVIKAQLEHASAELASANGELDMTNTQITDAAQKLQWINAEQITVSTASKDAARCINALADGDRTVSPEGDYAGCEELLYAVNKMKAHLCSLSMQLGRTADFMLSESERALRARDGIVENIREYSKQSEGLTSAVNGLIDSVSEENLGNMGKQSDDTAKQRHDNICAALNIAKRSAEDAIRSYSEIAGITEKISEIASGANVLAVNSALAAAKAMAGDVRGFAASADESRNLALKAAQLSGSISENMINFGERLKMCAELLAKASEIASGSVPEDKGNEDIAGLRSKLSEYASEISAAADAMKNIAISEVSADEWSSAARTLREQSRLLNHTAGRDKETDTDEGTEDIRRTTA